MGTGNYPLSSFLKGALASCFMIEYRLRCIGEAITVTLGTSK